jgi:hypothetical protein
MVAALGHDTLSARAQAAAKKAGLSPSTCCTFPEIESRAARMHRAPRVVLEAAPASHALRRPSEGRSSGKSTGPRTAEGLARSKRVTQGHCHYSAEAITERKEARRVVATCQPAQGALPWPILTKPFRVEAVRAAVAGARAKRRQPQ